MQLKTKVLATLKLFLKQKNKKMKISKLILAAVLVAGTIMVGCKGKGPKDFIVNKWKITDVSGGEAAQMTDSIKKVFLSSAVMDFQKDGKYSRTAFGQTENGAYSLSEDGKSLTTTPEGGKTPETVKVEELTKSKLVISIEGTKMTCEAK
jgi:hypothetical protein